MVGSPAEAAVTAPNIADGQVVRILNIGPIKRYFSGADEQHQFEIRVWSWTPREFDARDLASSVYVYHIQADGFVATRKPGLLK